MNKRPEFPKWAPADAILFMNDERAELERRRAELELRGDVGSDPRRDCPSLLHRLLTHEDMRNVWNALRLSKKKFPETVFAATAASAFCGPLDEARLTPAQHRKFVGEVQKLAWKLSKVLRGTELDYRLIVHLDLYHPEVGRHIWGRFSHILNEVGYSAIELAKESAGKRTHGEDARRAYFVPELTRFFREYLGGPRRELVAIATRAAFNDPSFGTRQVIRLSP